MMFRGLRNHVAATVARLTLCSILRKRTVDPLLCGFTGLAIESGSWSSLAGSIERLVRTVLAMTALPPDLEQGVHIHWR